MSGIDEMKMPSCSRCWGEHPWYEVKNIRGETLLYMVGDRGETFRGIKHPLKAELDIEECDWANETINNDMKGLKDVRVIICQNCEGIFTSADDEYVKFLSVLRKMLNEWEDV